MGRIADVLSVEADGNVKCDKGGGDSTIVDHFADSGGDSPPLPGDSAALVDGPRTGTEQSTGYYDPKNEGQAEPGEKRLYARDSDGVLVAEIWLKADGTITIQGVGAVTPQSYLRGEDFYLYLDAVIAATSTGLGSIPVVGTAVKGVFDAAITAALPLRVASISTVIKGE